MSTTPLAADRAIWVLAVWPQDKIELFAGYSHYHLDTLPSAELNGWEVSGEYTGIFFRS
jgi:hypothetical protein